ncbi:MAG TPA: hypothetical protein DDZ80_01985 [Cyanobacteria bacterium UBA8803]|nr:hypothetical protein [Cyanobacteria bacterium UBA8803]
MFTPLGAVISLVTTTSPLFIEVFIGIPEPVSSKFPSLLTIAPVALVALPPVNNWAKEGLDTCPVPDASVAKG